MAARMRRFYGCSDFNSGSMVLICVEIKDLPSLSVFKPGNLFYKSSANSPRSVISAGELNSGLLSWLPKRIRDSETFPLI